MLRSTAWHRALNINLAENCSGDHLENSKNCENCYFINGNEDCINCVRSVSGNDKNCLDSLSHWGGEFCFYSVLVQDNYYEIRTCFNVTQSQFLEYCANCYKCKNCFGCAGLVNKEFYIFNKPYSKDEYYILKAKIVDYMKSTDDYGKFFPSFFVPVPYNESWSAVHFPLSMQDQINLNFRVSIVPEKKAPANSVTAEQIPSDVKIVQEDLSRTFWGSF